MNPMSLLEVEVSPCEQRPRLSVVVPVYNRSKQLRCLLGALAKQTLPRECFEVVICDDGSTERLEPLVSAWATEFGLRLVFFRQANAGPGPARNLGLAHATGSVVAFTDSDCLPEPGWLAAFDRAFADPDVGLAGGHVLFRQAGHLSGRCINFVAGSSLGGAGATDPSSIFHMVFFPRTLNLAVRPELARAAGGFPGHSHGEDLEFSYRVGRSGTRTVFLKDAEIVHDERRNLIQVAKENYRKGAARVRLWRDCGMHEPLHAIPSLLVVAMATLVIAVLINQVTPLMAAALLAPYGMVLLALAIQGAFAIGDLRALVACPVYALIIHVSYGVGYLSEMIARSSANPRASAADWDALGAIGPVCRVNPCPVALDSAT